MTCKKCNEGNTINGKCWCCDFSKINRKDHKDAGICFECSDDLTQPEGICPNCSRDDFDDSYGPEPQGWEKGHNDNHIGF